MANIREIQTRINSVKDTMKITNAMYMISSTKMRQAKKKLTDSEPYFYGLQGEISRILRHIPEIEHRYFDVREEIPKEKRKKERISISVKKIILSHITMTQMSERRISSMFNQSPRFI